MNFKYQFPVVLMLALFVAGVFCSAPPQVVAEGRDPGVAPSDSVVLPRIVEKVQPEYPEAAVKRGIEGRVYLKVLVDEEGYVVKTTLDTARTFFSHPGKHNTAKIDSLLVEMASNAVKQWKFKPGTINGQPSAVEVTIPVQFELNTIQAGALGRPVHIDGPPPLYKPDELQSDNGTGKPMKDSEPDKK